VGRGVGSQGDTIFTLEEEEKMKKTYMSWKEFRLWVSIMGVNVVDFLETWGDSVLIKNEGVVFLITK
jgi:hypothetical protein